ncbi:hypothetical protein B1694_16680 [Geobacillus zalihae]|nr:hypothetical protein B1694_16680 [Geobacillus zalihae]
MELLAPRLHLMAMETASFVMDMDQAGEMPYSSLRCYDPEQTVNYHFISEQKSHFFAHSFRKPSPLF